MNATRYVIVTPGITINRLYHINTGSTDYRVRWQPAGFDDAWVVRSATWCDCPADAQLDALYAEAERTGVVYPLLDALRDRGTEGEAIDAATAALTQGVM